MALKIITCPECEEQIQIDDQAKRNRCAVCGSVIVRNRAPALPEKAKKPLSKSMQPDHAQMLFFLLLSVLAVPDS